MADDHYWFVMVSKPASEPGGWVDVRATHGKGARATAVRLQVKLRYSEGGELHCVGLRIGEASDGDGVRITRRMLCSLPLGKVLRLAQEADQANEDSEDQIPAPFGAPRLRVPEAGPRDDEYVRAAELFKREAQPGPKGNAEVYARLASETNCEVSTFRRHVQRGWALRPDLKPAGIRTRRVDDSWTSKRLTRKETP